MLHVDAGRRGILPDELVHGVCVERFVEHLREIVLHRPEEGTLGILRVAGRFQVLMDEPQRPRMDRHITRLPALAMNPEVHHVAP